MPELPEVETTRRGIAPYAVNQIVQCVIVRDARLRWPVPAILSKEMPGQRISNVERRGKYLLLKAGTHTLIIHLGMSGSLRVVTSGSPHEKHDHVDIELSQGFALRLRDPRRFGSIHWIKGDPNLHPLLVKLGLEPLAPEFTGEYLLQAARHRKVPVKSFIMNSHVVVGVGNIYASEALFAAGINPRKHAGKIKLVRYQLLADAVKTILAAAITQGGTTLRDFVSGDGSPGYFAQNLRVYGRTGEPCVICHRAIRAERIGQRNTFYCPHCQR